MFSGARKVQAGGQPGPHAPGQAGSGLSGRLRGLPLAQQLALLAPGGGPVLAGPPAGLGVGGGGAQPFAPDPLCQHFAGATRADVEALPAGGDGFVVVFGYLCSLDAAGLAAARADEAFVLHMLSVVEADMALAVVESLRYPLGELIPFVSAHLSELSTEELRGLLRAAGVSGPAQVGAEAERLLTAGAPWASLDLLAPLLEGDAGAQADLLHDAGAAGLIAELDAAHGLFDELGKLRADGAASLDAFKGSQVAAGVIAGSTSFGWLLTSRWTNQQAWVEELLVQGGDYLTLLAGVIQGEREAFRTTIDAIISAADPAKLAALQADALLVEAVATMATPGLGMSRAQAHEAGRDAASDLGQSAPETIVLAAQGGWLSEAAARTIADELTKQEAVARDDDAVTALSAAALSPYTVLADFVASHALSLAAFEQHEGFRGWMLEDWQGLGDFIGEIEADDAWMRAIAGTYRGSRRLLRKVRDSVTYGLWERIDEIGMYLELVESVGVVSRPVFLTLWRLYERRDRTADESIATFHALFGLKVRAPGERIAAWWNADQTEIWWAETVAPNDEAMRLAMKALRELPREHLMVDLAFAEEEVVATRESAADEWVDGERQRMHAAGFFAASDSVFVIKVSAGGDPGVQFAPTSKPGGHHGHVRGHDMSTESLVFTIRHEMGHAIGDIPGRLVTGGVGGDEAASQWMEWSFDTSDAFLDAMWSASGEIELPGGSSISADVLADWAVQTLRAQAEPGSHDAIDALGGETLEARIATLGQVDAVEAEHLLRYLEFASGRFGGDQHIWKGYEPPADRVHLYSPYNRSFVSYSRARGEELLQSHSWYALASPAECFAEIYALYVTLGASTLPPTRSGVDWATLFANLFDPSAVQGGPGAIDDPSQR